MDYKKILKGIVDIINTTEKSDIGFANICTYIGENCPELKESEDERVSKALIHLITEQDGYLTAVNGISTKDILAWLEKQRDKDKLIQELGEYKVKYTQEVSEKHINNMNNKDDERLRKTAIVFLKEFADKGYENAVECIDWLEKQGDNVNGECNDAALEKQLKIWFEKGKCSGIDDVVFHPEKYGLEKQDKPMEINPTEFDTRLQTLIGKFDSLPKEELIGSLSFWLNVVQNNGTYKPTKKQGEQKLADKVEPKFKVGDWITNGTVMPAQISSIEDDLYFTHNGTVGGDIESMDKEYHLWTIQDAKDGDVLAASDGSIFLFAGVVDCACKHYVALTTDGAIKFNEGLEHYWETSTAVHPATKEQRDTLMKAMADAGYTFDFEKKELKKIEQKPLLSDFFNAEYERGKADTLQSIEWSEEDKDYYDAIIAKLEVTQDDAGLTDNQMEFLKSLKQRIGG